MISCGMISTFLPLRCDCDGGEGAFSMYVLFVLFIERAALSYRISSSSCYVVQRRTNGWEKGL